MSKKLFRKGILALAVSSVMGLSTHALADVVIGVAGPHTGANASFGEQYWRGASQAAEDINAAGGINGEKIKLVKADDACEPKQAVAVANRLVDQDKAIAVVGHFCSSSTIPASEVYDEADYIRNYSDFMLEVHTRHRAQHHHAPPAAHDGSTKDAQAVPASPEHKSRIDEELVLNIR